MRGVLTSVPDLANLRQVPQILHAIESRPWTGATLCKKVTDMRYLWYATKILTQLRTTYKPRNLDMLNSFSNLAYLFAP